MSNDTKVYPMLSVEDIDKIKRYFLSGENRFKESLVIKLRNCAMVLLNFELGLRSSKLLGLKNGDLFGINKSLLSVIVVDNNMHIETAKFNKVVKETLIEYFQMKYPNETPFDKNDLLFDSRKKASKNIPIHKNSLWKILKDASIETGIDIVNESIRKTHKINLIKENVDNPKVLLAMNKKISRFKETGTIFEKIDGIINDLDALKKNANETLSLQKSIEINIAISKWKSTLKDLYIFMDDVLNEKSESNAVDINDENLFEIKFDVSKFDDIRASADAISEKLLTEHQDNVVNKEKQEYVDAFNSTNINDIWFAYIKTLLPFEIQAIKIILEQECVINKLELLSIKNAKMTEVILESINSKALDVLGDNLIDTTEDIPHIYEEYAELLDEII